jgi:hypothetical protein
MNYRNRRIIHFLLMSIVALGTVGCSPADRPLKSPVESHKDLNGELPKDVREMQLARGGRALIKDTGWQVAYSNTGRGEQARITAKTIDGLEVPIDLTSYRPEFGSIRLAEDVAASIGLGNLNVQTMLEYKVKDRTFAYAIGANQIDLDENNKITGSRMMIMNFMFYDEDGDGRFETLIKSDPVFNTTRRPQVPQWAAQVSR